MVSKIILIITTALLMSTAYAIPNSLMYVGFESTEALLEFNGTVQLDAETIPTEKVLREIIESQLEHIVGPMSLSSITAVPKGDHVVTNIKIISRKKLTLTVSYHYNGTLLIQNGPQNTFPIFLPVSPDKIYASSMVGETNPCTDDHYQSEGDFWYFWSPKRAGCKLIEGKDYIIINASIHRYKNTKISYPEYQNLPDQNGNITIHVLFGMDDTTQDRNPLLSNDINAENYRSFRNYLVKNGYKVTTWSDEQISSIAKTLDGVAPFVETVKKGKLEYRFFFAPTGINEEALGFHWFYKDALENASIVMYEGHSGLGGHLDLDSIENNLGEQINFSKRYQIYFFDSCTSYRYYNDAYFKRKMNSEDLKGTKKLDIFTNGLATTFNSMTDSSTALDTALEKALNYASAGNGFISYQTIAKQIDSHNLFGINGDEDNIAPSKIK